MTLPKLHRKGFGLKKEVAPALERDYHSEFVAELRLGGNRLSLPQLDIVVAKEFGFCYGVDRAIDYAYETRAKFPDKRLFLTSEIIHNPRVNRRLREMGYEFLDGAYGSERGWDDLESTDIVLLPAFGATTDEMERLERVGCLLVDTTCGSVLNVWKNVEKFARRGVTCLIHGKYAHEETRATASRALLYPEGRYLIVLDLDQAKLVARYIRGDLGRDEFMATFASAASPGFDPDQHLERVGMANQTTMLSTESIAVGEIVHVALVEKYGDRDAEERFNSFDTICSATQERQDAVIEMMQAPPDVVLIVGGFNSSNTGHLAEICGAKSPTFHVEGADDLGDGRSIRHLRPGAKEPETSGEWLANGPLTVGITAGASTPDREIGKVIEKLCQLRGVALSLPSL